MHFSHWERLRCSQKFNPVPDVDHTLYGEYGGVRDAFDAPEGDCVLRDACIATALDFCVLLRREKLFVWCLCGQVCCQPSSSQSKLPLCLLIWQLCQWHQIKDRLWKLKAFKNQKVISNCANACRISLHSTTQKPMKRDDLERRCYIIHLRHFITQKAYEDMMQAG